MKSKYIKDTNKQYSIREDGVVIRHYRICGKNKLLYYNNVIKTVKTLHKGRLQLNLDNSNYRIRINLAKLVYSSFINNEISKLEKIINIDNNELNCSINNLKKVNSNVFVDIKRGIAMNKEEVSKRNYQLNKNRLSYKKYQKIYQRIYQRKLGREASLVINKRYVAKLLRIPITLIDTSLLYAKRAQLKLHRLTKINKL